MSAATSTAAATLGVSLQYGTTSGLEVQGGAQRVQLALDGRGSEVGLRGRVRDAGLFRDALATAAAVLRSDARYRGRDRAAYLAYLAKKGKKASAAIWEAQKAFLESAFQDEERTTGVLDPLLTVHPDEVSLEVFSRDESAYARLALSNGLFDEREAAHGTAFADLSEGLLEGVEKLRSYQPVRLDAGARAPATTPGSTSNAPGARSLEVPYAWIRGFLQVQSAATLPAERCDLAPIDLYNLLFALRTRKARTSPRALRFELVPGAPARIVLEPWEVVLESHGAPYRGSTARVVRTFGRQRLMALARLLPHVRSARVHLLGPGLPVFWVLDLGVASLTLGLTGWSDSGWSSAASFDALMPGEGASILARRATELLDARGPQTFEALREALGASASEVHAALQSACLEGKALYDLAGSVYRPRALLPQALPVEKLRFGSEREARAHRLLEDKGVRLTKLHEVAGEGLEVHGEVTDRAAHRDFTPKFLLDLEGRARDAACGCPQFRRAGLREGPCEHMIALRLAYARQRAQEEALRQTPEGRALIRAETRTYVRREGIGAETVYRVSLDGQRVHVRWGLRASEPRQQQLWFDTDRDAREAYFGKVESLLREGFIDADAAAG